MQIRVFSVDLHEAFGTLRKDRGPKGLLVYGGGERQARSLGTVTGLPTLVECLPPL